MGSFPNDKRYVYLNRNSALPLYYQLKEHIKDAILKGQYKPNDRLPTEEELCKQFSISRPVVRHAYEELTKEGLIGRRKGSGTFVKQQSYKSSLFEEFIDFSFEKNIIDIEKNSKIIKRNTIVNSNISSRMNIPEDSELLNLSRIIYNNGYPISIIESYLPCQYFLNIDNYIQFPFAKTIIETVETMYGIYIQKAIRNLTAVQISEEKVKFLQGNLGELAYEIETKYLDTSNRVVVLEYVTSLISKNQFVVEINRK